MNPEIRSVLQRLPVPRWLNQFEDGTVRITGELNHEVSIEIDRFRLRIPRGTLRLSLVFRGGTQAFVSKLYVDAPQMYWTDADRSVDGTAWRWQEGLAFINDTPLGRVEGRKGTIVEALVQHLSNVHAEVRVVPAVPLRLRSTSRLLVQVPAGVVMTAVGCTEGAPDSLTLVRPMVVGFGGQGVEVVVSRFKRLSRLLSVRIHRLTLHPDGRIEVDGQGTKGFGRAVNRGLRATGDILSEVMKEHATYAAIRPFLVSR